jgi:geranylgeranyl pyrophosphate synthase
MELEGFLHEVDRGAQQALAVGAEALGVPPHALGVLGGKRLRSRLAFECARSLNADPLRIAPVAAAIEMIHAASLCHDDVIDSASLRRGRPTANAQYGNQASVLLGDFLFSSAWLAVARGQHPGVAPLLAEAMVEMSRAEIRQSRLLWNAQTSMSDSLDVIAGKTAALFAACAESTALALGAPDAATQAFRAFGRGLGMAYQIADDLLDYFGEHDAWGKRPMMDLRGGLITLPLLLALERGNGSARHAVLAHVESRGTSALDPSLVSDFIRSSGAAEACGALARRFVSEGLSALDGSCRSDALALFAREALGRSF